MYQPAMRVIAIVLLCSLVLPALAHKPKHAPERPLALPEEPKAA